MTIHTFIGSPLPRLRSQDPFARSFCSRKPIQSAMAPPKVQITLYGSAVSNYTARCRYLIKRKNLPDDVVSLCSPKELGGMKTESYLKLNPLGKMPLLVVSKSGHEDDALFESSIICEYLSEEFADLQPSFRPDAPEARAKARLIANLLDIYVGPHHPYMYKKLDGDRMAGAQKMVQGFDAIEHVLDPTGPYATGKALSIADCCLLGNFPFYDYMLPTFFGWKPTDGRPRLKAWREHMINESPAARETYSEVFNALQVWWDNDRWVNLGMKPLTPRPSLPF